MIKKLFLATLIGGLMVATIGAYAAALGGTTTVDGLGSSGDVQVNAPGVGNVDMTWDIDESNSSSNFGLVTGLSLAVQNAPGAGEAYDILVRVEGANNSLLGGATGTIAGSATSIDLEFGDELDPRDIENVIVVVNEG